MSEGKCAYVQRLRIFILIWCSIILFCTDKDETMVKHSVLQESQQIFASKYMTILPTVEELQKELGRNQLIYRREN